MLYSERCFEDCVGLCCDLEPTACDVARCVGALAMVSPAVPGREPLAGVDKSCAPRSRTDVVGDQCCPHNYT